MLRPLSYSNRRDMPHETAIGNKMQERAAEALNFLPPLASQTRADLVALYPSVPDYLPVSVSLRVADEGDGSVRVALTAGVAREGGEGAQRTLPEPSQWSAWHPRMIKARGTLRGSF